MKATSFAQRKAIENANKKRWLKVNGDLCDACGIYILTRTDESNVQYAYVGQSVHILTRLAEHLVGYQHIDSSLRKHGLYDCEKNPCGWRVKYELCTQDELDKAEREWWREMVANGYQMRNKTSGGQDSGKVATADYKPSKGYRQGVEHGRKEIAREFVRITDKYVVLTPKDGKLAQKQFEKLNNLLDEYGR